MPAEMSSKELFLSRLEGGPASRIPIFLRDFTLGMDVAGLRAADVFSNGYDPEISSESIISFQRFTGQDAVIGCVHSPAFIIEQYGGRMKYPDNGMPTVAEAPLSRPESLDHVDLSPKGSALNAIKSYSVVRNKLPDVAIVANVTGPLTKASVLMGMERLSIALLNDPDFVDEVIRSGIEFTKIVLERLYSDDSVDCVFIASASDNPDLFGKDIYEDLTLKNIRPLIDSIHSSGYRAIFHPHGDFTNGDILSKTISTHIDGFQFAENNDPAIISEIIGRRCAVLGGTDIVPTLISGNESTIRAETDRYISSCLGTNYIFTCSCSLQRGVPLEKIRIMMDEAASFNGASNNAT